MKWVTIQDPEEFTVIICEKATVLGPLRNCSIMF